MKDGAFDQVVVEAIKRIRGGSFALSRQRDPWRMMSPIAAGRWTVIALTNNFSTPFEALAADPSPKARAELEFLGLNEHGGPASDAIKTMFDDFIDSSVVGSR